MSEKEFIDKYLNKEFANGEVLEDYIYSKKLKLTQLKNISKVLKNTLIRFPGCTNKNKDKIIVIFKERYEIFLKEDIERAFIKKEDRLVEEEVEEEVEERSKFILNKKGQEVVVVTTEEEAKQLQNQLDAEETMENKLIKLEMERNELIDTVGNLTKENTKLKDQIKCSQTYVCSTDEKCNLKMDSCVPNSDTIEEEEEDLVEFVTSEGHKYIGNKLQIDKLKGKLGNKTQLIDISRTISEPTELDENIHEMNIEPTFTNTHIEEQQKISDRINSILSIS